jgi:hypothetical protein
MAYPLNGRGLLRLEGFIPELSAKASPRILKKLNI